MHIIEEQLGQQMLGTRCLLDAQVLHIVQQGVGLGVALRVAGTVDGEIRLLPFNKGGQVTGVFEVGAFGADRAAVTAQGQHIANADGLQLVKDFGSAGLVVAHADEVCQCGNVQLVLDVVRYLGGGNAARRAARAESHADEARSQRLHLLQRVLELVHLGGLLRGKAFNRENAALSFELFGDRHFFLLIVTPQVRRNPRWFPQSEYHFAR